MNPFVKQIIVYSYFITMQPSPGAVILSLPTSVAVGVVDESVSFPLGFISKVMSDGYGCWPSPPEWVFVAREGE